MIEYFKTIVNEMLKGNYSFTICILNFLQLVVAIMMFRIAKGKKRRRYGRYKCHKYKMGINKK